VTVGGHMLAHLMKEKTPPLLFMNKFVFILTICLISSNLFADDTSKCQIDFVKTLHQPYPNCEVINENAIKYARILYEAGYLDSACMVFERCRAICYIPVTNEYFYFLLRIMTGGFPDSLIDSSFFENAIYYHHWKEYPKNRYNLSNYGIFITHLADSLASTTDPKSTDHLIALLIAGKFDIFYYLLRHEPAFRDSKLKKYYNKSIEKIQRPDFFDLPWFLLFPPVDPACIGAFVGAWLPIGGLGVTGQHPEVGFLFGNKFWRFSGDLYVACRFLDSKFSYLIGYKDTAYSTNHFLGGQIGVDVGFTLVKKRNWQIDALMNGGIEGIEGLKKNDSLHIPNKGLYSLFFGPGLGCRIFLGRNREIVLNPQIWYSFLNYESSNIGGSNVNGGAISIRLVIHNSMYREDYKLTRLHFYDK
jgi:hypothetical protein